ncbi:MAG: hypothetical protein HYZ63_02100 [Candidatus Andersenbacteria bacterium]|nr:hypothetical protein [Candidatus Andersenbacteria bacterium]
MPKNVSLWIGLAIPVVMVLVVALSIYWPQRGIEAPVYDFVYALQNYSDGYVYSVVDGKLGRDATPDYGQPKPVPAGVAHAPTRFYIHDVQSNTSREVSFEEASTVKLDNVTTAPDGYELKRGGEGSGVFPFFFSEGNYNDQYLVKGNHSIKLDLKEIRDPYYSPFTFMAWVIQ